MDEKQKEFLVLAVKLLFKRIKDGKVQFAADKVPQTIKALDAVRFDENGDPIFETISGPVRALANLVFTHEVEHLEDEAVEREKNSPVHEFLVKPVEVTDEVLGNYTEETQFSALAFELYKETGCVLSVCAHSYMGEGEQEILLNRDQAICAGLLVRIVKFMLAVTRLTGRTEPGEVILALNRSIIESAINLRFLVLKKDPRFYDQFVRFSLAPERELYDLVKKNIRKRGGKELPIETRMLASIQRMCELSGVKIEDIDPKYRDWGNGVRNRLKALSQEDLYVLGQRMPSHAVHGTWVDLLLHHLETKEGRFAPDPTWSRVDARLLAPVCLIVLHAGRDYLGTFLVDLPELKPLYARMDNLAERILKLDRAHEEWLTDHYQKK